MLLCEPASPIPHCLELLAMVLLGIEKGDILVPEHQIICINTVIEDLEFYSVAC